MAVHLVLAGSAGEAADWARSEGLTGRQWLYGGSPAGVDGLSDFVTVMLPGFVNHPRAAQILDVVRRCEVKQGGTRAVAGA